MESASFSPSISATDHPSSSVYPSSKSANPSISPTVVSSVKSSMPTRRPCDPPEGYPLISMTPSQAPSNSTNTPTMIPTNEPSSVPSERKCFDDITYRSPINSIFGCNLYCGTECSKWSVLLSTDQMQELFTRCPDTCKVPCGYIFPISSPGYSPSSVPTFSSRPPFISKAPSVSPSRYSTKSPDANFSTNIPSSNFDESQSSSPSFKADVGTSFPSLQHNLTYAPSSVPSANVGQTYSPSSMVSYIPSLQKSQHPSTFSPNPSTSPICGVSHDERLDDIYILLSTVSESNHLQDINTPQGKAFHWIAQEDGAYLCANHVYSCPNALIQRYILAVIYFSTNGNEWFQCSASSNAQDDCGMEYPFVSKQRFLNSGSECNWAGIDCNDAQCVTRVEFGKLSVRNLCK